MNSTSLCLVIWNLWGRVTQSFLSLKSCQFSFQTIPVLVRSWATSHIDSWQCNIYLIKSQWKSCLPQAFQANSNSYSVFPRLVKTYFYLLKKHVFAQSSSTQQVENAYSQAHGYSGSDTWIWEYSVYSPLFDLVGTSKSSNDLKWKKYILGFKRDVVIRCLTRSLATCAETDKHYA